MAIEFTKEDIVLFINWMNKSDLENTQEIDRYINFKNQINTAISSVNCESPWEPHAWYGDGLINNNSINEKTLQDFLNNNLNQYLNNNN